MHLALGHGVIEPFLGGDRFAVSVRKLSVLTVDVEMSPCLGSLQKTKKEHVENGLKRGSTFKTLLLRRRGCWPRRAGAHRWRAAYWRT